jgi:hypothetical protein
MQETVVPIGMWRKITGGTDGGPIHLAADPPIYAAVALRWRQAGRMLPGQVDREWSELVVDAPDLGLRSEQDATSGVVSEAGGSGVVGGARLLAGAAEPAGSGGLGWAPPDPRSDGPRWVRLVVCLSFE